ncbi:MAG: hypothetical protein SFT93_02615 [Rickettsiaceae bacterium]|nr:hypothetical protein [Rickettsiaceae bacterium]
MLKLTIDETFYLSDNIPEKVLVILSNGTGISIDDLRWRNTSSVYKKWKEEYEVRLKREFARKFANEVIVKLGYKNCYNSPQKVEKYVTCIIKLHHLCRIILPTIFS